MPVDLSTPLSWTTATGDAATMLEELQPNILKAHVRDHLSVLFLSFGNPGEAKTFLKALVGLMKSAKAHLDEIGAFKTTQAAGTPYVGLGLSANAYATLGIAAVPGDTSFAGGAKAATEKLTDPAVTDWEAPYQATIDAVVLVGDANADAAAARLAEVKALLPGSITVAGEETGKSLINENGDGIEHFGYVDGRSQPLFLTEDAREEQLTTDGTNEWDPATALDRVLQPDPAAPNPDVHFGSYFVFRKLEQNVRLFKEAEEGLADKLGLQDEDRERAGAMLIGRFEDGTPVTLQSEAGSHNPVENDFSYFSDPEGQKCPFQAHIRKTNPRGSGGFGQTPEQERRHLMARRGQTYGKRDDDPNGDIPPEERPTGGVGLLFMAFNSEIGNQFEFTQQTWANNPTFPEVTLPDHLQPDLDPVIGQGTRAGAHYPPKWGGVENVTSDPVPQAVTMKGGEYFFMPSLAFLRAL